MAAKQAIGSGSDEPSTDAHIDLLTEHFGFSPRVFIDDIVDAANEHLYSIAGQFEDYVKEQLRRQEKKKKVRSREKVATDDSEAERGVHTILTLMENALDIAFDALEMYCLKTVFGIRPSQAKYMALEHHRGLDLRTPVEKARDGDLGAPSAEEEHKHLQEREKQLQSQIDTARKVRHALLLANASAKRSLLQTQQINEIFSVLLSRSDGRQQLPSILPESARKLSADASSLLRAMDLLISTDSLGTSLLSVEGGAKGKNEGDRKRVMEESGASEQERKDWEQGREQYINWEIDRIYKSVYQQRSSDVGNQSRLSISSGLKRRKTDEPTGQADAVGDTIELERLAEYMERG